MTADRYALCDDTCTVDCGACKGAGRPSAPTPPEVREAAVIEEVARAMHEVPGQPGVYGRIPWGVLIESHRDAYRTMARVAVAAYRSAQDGEAEEAVRRVEALAEHFEAMPVASQFLHVSTLRAALAPQAGKAGQ